MSEPDFIVHGKIVSDDPSGPLTTQFICSIGDDIWWVPDDMGNVDRQRVQLWIDAGNPVPDITPEDVTRLTQDS